MKRTPRLCAALVAALSAGAALAGVEDTVWNAQKERARTLKPANAKRLRWAGATGDVAFFAVPAMSDLMRLDDTWPDDGALGGTVRCVVAQDEFESCSFELFAFRDLDGVELSVDLDLPSDLRVVKVWFQNGNGWTSYFDDVGLKLVPELLLHDENLIRVTKEKGGPANHARVRRDGKDTWVWISSPKEMNPKEEPWQYDPGFADADRLLPVSLWKDSFKQFFLTVHPPKDCKPGVYKGSVAVTRTGTELARIPLAVRVLPFSLPLPKGYLERDKAYLHSCMAAMPSLDRLAKKCGGDEERAKACFRAWLQSLYDHSVFHAPWIGPSNEWCVPMLREIGFPLDVVFGSSMVPWFALNFGGRMSYKHLRSAQDSAKKCAEFYARVLPGSKILCSHGDEQGAAFVTTHRELFREYARNGIAMGCAGHAALLYKGGYAYGFQPMAGSPDEAYDKSRPWREAGTYPIGFYAMQHTGSENPQFTRRQHGLLGWLNGMTMAYNYEFAVGSFNDRANVLYRPMVVTYANGQGLMETIQYAGFREACDDIRYASYLLDLAERAAASDDVDVRLLGRKARLYLATLPGETMDLDAVRLEIVEKILALRAALGDDPAPAVAATKEGGTK